MPRRRSLAFLHSIPFEGGKMAVPGEKAYVRAHNPTCDTHAASIRIPCSLCDAGGLRIVSQHMET